MTELVDQRFADDADDVSVLRRRLPRSATETAGRGRATGCRGPTGARSAACPDRAPAACRQARSPSRRATRPTARLRSRWRRCARVARIGREWNRSLPRRARETRSRVIALAPRRRGVVARAFGALDVVRVRGARAFFDAPVTAKVADHTHVARAHCGVGLQTRRPCRISVSDARVQRAGGSRAVSDRLYLDSVVRVDQAKASCDPQHVAIDREARARQARARARRWQSCGQRRADPSGPPCSRAPGRRDSRPGRRHPDDRSRFLPKEPGGVDQGLEIHGVGAEPAPPAWGSVRTAPA